MHITCQPLKNCRVSFYMDVERRKSRLFQCQQPPYGNIMCDLRGLAKAGRLWSVSSRVICDMT